MVLLIPRGLTGAFGTGSIVLTGSDISTVPPYTTALLTSNYKVLFSFVYAYNVSCTTGDNYDLTDLPLQNSDTTCVAAATGLLVGSPTTSTLTLTWTSVTGGNLVNPIPYTVQDVCEQCAYYACGNISGYHRFFLYSNRACDGRSILVYRNRTRTLL